MEWQPLLDELRQKLAPGSVRIDEPLAPHTVWRIGGPADVLVVARSAQDLIAATGSARSHSAQFLILGAGSNVLIDDAGVRGVVIVNRARAIDIAGQSVRAESGAMLATVARRCVARGLAGLEWAAGIPGTIGGALFGNAGAWGGDVAATLVQAGVIEPDGTAATWPRERFQFGYRTSLLKQSAAQANRPAVIVDAEFGLKPGERGALETRLEELAARRRASQPPGASSGSVFKNPAGDYAGRLIEAAGLKGRQHGGALISPLHANFIVNTGGATATDVLALIDVARQAVHERFGVWLELEIELVGARPGRPVKSNERGQD